LHLDRALLLFVLLLLPVAAVSGCRTAAIVQPGAPGQAARVITPDQVDALPQPRFSEADVRFMQGMIGHHAQALEMTALVPARTARDEMRLLAQRIEVSQADEIRMMERWLRDRGQPLPDPHAHHKPGGLMPGMLTADEMGRLAGARGTDFDRLFLEFMIRHHEGAVVMVRELYGSPGAAQEGEVYEFASDVDADQRMEIDRMRALLDSLRRDAEVLYQS
jgi:uncharacterized protein (DUF305 family)